MRQKLNLPSELDGCVWQYAPRSVANRRHTHPELELNLITRGTGTYLIGNQRYQIRRGDLLWLFPEQEHVLMEQSSDFRMWIAVFRRRAIRRLSADPSARVLLKPMLRADLCRRLAQQEVQRLELLLAELTPLYGQPAVANAGLTYALGLAWHAFRNASGVPVRDVHPAVERASRLIRDTDSALPLEVLTRGAGLSPARLSRLFHQQTGFTLVDFRNRQRMERFFDIYGTGQRQTMLSAALEAGFGSYPQFHRVFTRTMGCSPRDYRREEAS